MGCKANEYADAGLCYDKCANGFDDGHGPVCWQRCPAGTEQCGALCMAAGESCDAWVVGAVANAAVVAAGIVTGGPVSPLALLDVLGLADDYIHPMCPV